MLRFTKAQAYGNDFLYVRSADLPAATPVDALVVAPGGTQRVERRDDNVYLTGWAEVLFDGVWRRPTLI